jgi:hypothetical protein
VFGLFSCHPDRLSGVEPASSCTGWAELSVDRKVTYEQARTYIIDHRIRDSGDPRSRPRWTVGSKDDEAGCDSDINGANDNPGSSDDADPVSRYSNNPTCQSAIALCQAATAVVTAWQGVY